MRLGRLLGVIVVSAALAVSALPCAFAQEIAPTGEYKEGVAVGGWTLYPKIFMGGVFDDNVHQGATSDERTDRWGARLVPHLVGTWDGGIHKVSAYGVVDARFFDTNTIAATAGFTHYYEAMRDLLLTFGGNYTRQTDLYNSALNFNNGALGPNTSTSGDANLPIILNPFGTTPGANPVAYNQFTGATSVRKDVEQAFTTLSATVFHIAFDRSSNSSVSSPFDTSHDGTSVWVTGRLGYNVTPKVFVFAESSGIFQRFNNSLFDTNGYRVVGGVGSNDPESFFRGEIFGGYQAQYQLQQDATSSGIPTTLTSPIFGGRVYYYPTRYWTFMAQADESLGMTTLLSSTIPQGTPSRVINSILQTNYALSRIWSVGARLGYTRSEFFGIDRLDESWMAGASFNYEIWRNLLLTLDYQHIIGQSNAALSDFRRDVYTAGLTYKY